MIGFHAKWMRVSILQMGLEWVLPSAFDEIFLWLFCINKTLLACMALRLVHKAQDNMTGRHITAGMV